MKHIEDHLTLDINELLVNDDKITDKKYNRILSCKPEDNHCYHGNTVYVCDKIEKPGCDLYEAKEAVQCMITTANNLKYFSSNTSRIHLKITKEISKCERIIYKTEFKYIFLLPLENQHPILLSLPSIELSILKAFSTQNSFICNKLSHLIEDNIVGLASHHCKDNVLSTRQWTKVITRANANKLQPFSFYPESDRFFFAFWGKVFAHFHVGKGYSNLYH